MLTINEEQGSVLVIAIFILLILTLLGMYATNTSTFELMISGNDKVSKINLYKAESAAYVGAKRIEELSTKPNSGAADWFYPKSNPADLSDPNTWTDAKSEKVQALGDVRYVVSDGGKYIAPGIALNIGPAQINKFHITGRSAELGGKSIVTIGYKKEYY